MDLITPDGSGSTPRPPTAAKPEDLAWALDRSTTAFFATADQPPPGETVRLLRSWHATRTPAGRQVVFACVREVLTAQAA